MKKILVFLLAFSVVGGAAFAQNLGLTAGVEFNIDALNSDDFDATDSPGTAIRPFLIWENDELVEGLELEAELGLPFWTNYAGDGNFWMDLDLRLFAGYHFGIGSDGTLRLHLESDNYFELASEYDNDAAGTLEFGVKYTHDLGNGLSLFGKVALPFLLYSTGPLGAFDWVGLDFTLGMSAEINPGVFGFELAFYNNIEGYDHFAHELSLLPSFEFSAIPLYIEVEFVIPLWENGMDWSGMSIIPEVSYEIIPGLEAWLNLPIHGIGSNFDATVGLGLGIQFSF